MFKWLINIFVRTSVSANNGSVSIGGNNNAPIIININSNSDSDGTINLIPELIPAKDKVDTAVIQSKRIQFTLIFDGEIKDWNPDKINTILELLQKWTGDMELSFVKIEEGSVRLIFNVLEKDVSILSINNLRNKLVVSDEYLVGAISLSDLNEIPAYKSALVTSSAALLSWDSNLPNGAWLERNEKATIESRFESNFSSTVLLGEPGLGKSALLSVLARELVESGAGVLAIKADHISKNVTDQVGLKDDIGLPVPPIEMILKFAQSSPIFLIIDQLDALASQLDLTSCRLNVLLNLVRGVGGKENVHVLVSARTFEFNHDVRLKAIDAEAVNLALPAWNLVKAELAKRGIDADPWPANAKELIRSPQNLKTYLQIDIKPGDQPFSKYQTMLEKLWEQKVLSQPNSNEVASLASDIAGQMAEEETLWLAVSRFDSRHKFLAQLESSDLIVRSSNALSLAFSHQTVFDFIFARSFVQAENRLSTYVIDRQDSLFVRSKLWSGLNYLRNAELVSYEKEFLNIWNFRELRLHLKLLLISFLGEVRKPVDFEKVCLNVAISSDETRIAALKAIVGNADWFSVFSRTAIPAAMNGDDIAANEALRVLEAAWAFASDENVRLINENWIQIQARDGFTWSVLNKCPSWDLKKLEIAEIVLARTSIAPNAVDHTASIVAVDQPKIALGIVRAKLAYQLEKAKLVKLEVPFPEGSDRATQVEWTIGHNPDKPFTDILENTEWYSLTAIAEAAPKEFLEILWPVYSDIFYKLKEYCRDQIRSHRYPGSFAVDIDFDENHSRLQSMEYPVLIGLRLAVEKTAGEFTDDFMAWAEASSQVEFMVFQNLVAHGFTSAPQTYADYAFGWLWEDSRRLNLDQKHVYSDITHKLVVSVSPYWAKNQLDEFQSRVINYAPEAPSDISPENRRRFIQSIATVKAQLLSALPADALSKDSRDLVEMYRREHGESVRPGIELIRGGFIGSPMARLQMSKASDAEILNIFDKISDVTDWSHPTRDMYGGNIQLSREFAEFAKAEPDRALKIICQFKKDCQERAAGYALDAIADLQGYESSIETTILELDSKGFKHDEFRNAAANTAEKISRRIPLFNSQLVDVFTRWLAELNLPDDRTDKKDPSENPNEDRQLEKSKFGGEESILWGHPGMSLLPSGSFPALSALISILLLDEAEQRDRLFSILDLHLDRETNPRIWQALLIRLGNAGGRTPKIVSAFLKKLFRRWPELIETRELVVFLGYVQTWDDALVYEIIEHWHTNENQFIRQAQGELVGLISTLKSTDLWNQFAEKLLNQGSDEAKIGLAHVGAYLWNHPGFHVKAGELLTRLVQDADKTRMSAILDVFRVCDELAPEPVTLRFLEALAQPDTDLRGAPSIFMVEKLQSLIPYASDYVGALALKLIEIWRNDLNDIRTAAALDAQQLMDIAITLHRQGGKERQTAITIFESLIEIDALGVRDTLNEIDSRPSASNSTGLARIPKRKINKQKLSH